MNRENNRMASDSRPWPLPRIVGIVLGILGLAVAVAGGWLLALGGSAYYLPAGVLMFLCGILLLTLNSAALGAYALLLGATLVWALWESGLDWWPLAARLDLLYVVGLLLVTPWIRRGLGRPATELRAAVPAPLRSGGGLMLRRMRRPA
jgi:quinoprotein glucose dehydrogenase